MISSGSAHFFDTEGNLCVFTAEEDTTGYVVNGTSSGTQASTGFSLAGKKGGANIASKQTKLFDTYACFNICNISAITATRIQHLGTEEGTEGQDAKPAFLLRCPLRARLRPLSARRGDHQPGRGQGPQLAGPLHLRLGHPSVEEAIRVRPAFGKGPAHPDARRPSFLPLRRAVRREGARRAVDAEHQHCKLG